MAIPRFPRSLPMSMPRIHEAEINPRRITVDGLDLTVDKDVHIEQIDNDLHLLKVNIYCRSITLDGDHHANPESTPIWDQLVAERGDPATTEGEK